MRNLLLQQPISNGTISVHILGLEILYSLLRNVEKSEASAQQFYQTYFIMILQHIFSVVTDTSHTAGTVNTASLPCPNFATVVIQ